MAFTDMNEEVEEEVAGQPPEESGNRTFVIAAVILGAVFILGLVCIAVYALLIYPSAKRSQLSAQQTVAAQATEVSFAATQTGIASQWTPTPKPTKTPEPTIAPTNTPVVQQGQPTATLVDSDEDAAEATRSALLTEVALAQLTVIPTSTLLPEGGIADEIGAPALLALAVVLVVVIFLARRLRSR
ncbi:MAG: hypothetical protein JW726_00055 [Anaerolineales bacterium]|nr:hypothetical protein [Anaerolineales bacterium]